MTREEARREIDSLDFYLQNHTDDYGEESHTAMMMAIKALEKEPCEDTISRQAAIDALDVLCQEHRYKIPGKIETYSQYNEAWQDALDRAEGAIFNLPSAQPEQQWIPCSERLPEDDDDVIITTGFEIYIGWFDADNHTWRLRNDYITSIVAWMPLPEPYKAESEV